MTAEVPNAITDLASLGARFVCWKWVIRNDKRTKPPLQATGELADRRETGRRWYRLVFDARRDDILGFDLDGCRDAQSGKIEAWATKIINGLMSYTEVSPSGTGVKILVKADPVPHLAAHKAVIQKANGSGKDQAVEVYSTGRYFTLTGEILPGVPDEIVEATDAVEKLVHWIGRQAGASSSNSNAELPPAFLNLLEHEDELRHAWRDGIKLGGGSDTSASALDWSLALYLRAALNDAEIAAVLRLHPHGQIGGGKLRGRDADRRIEKILAELPLRSNSAADSEGSRTMCRPNNRGQIPWRRKRTAASSARLSA